MLQRLDLESCRAEAMLRLLSLSTILLYENMQPFERDQGRTQGGLGFGLKKNP